MKIPVLGVVKKAQQYGNEVCVSKRMPIPFLRGHKCSFVLKDYLDDDHKDEFHTALSNAMAADDSVLEEAQPHVIRYCSDMLRLFGDDGPMKPVKNPSDIWKHVHFGDTFYVRRRDRGDKEDGIYFSLECECDWEEEHGLQITLRDGLKITKVGPYDGHVTNADAFGSSRLVGVVYKAMGR